MAQHLTELERKYNEICSAAFHNIFTTTKKWKTIPITRLNLEDPEHLFILHVALALGGVTEKQVAINKSKFQIWRLNRKLHIRDKGARIIQITDEQDDGSMVDPDVLLTFMRPTAKKLCGPLFTFGDIYHEFYELKKGKKQ
jgi:hypothetical protein